MAATHASKEAVWLQRLCSGIGLVQEAVRIESDSQSAIFLAKNHAYHSKTKHIDVQYHFVRDMIEEKKVSLMKVDTLKNVADSLKKSVSTEKLSWCRGSMGITALDCSVCNPVTPCVQRKQQVGECWVCVIFFARVVASEHLHRVHRGVRGGCRGAEPPNFFFFRTTYFRDHMILGGFSAHGFLPMVFYFRLRS
jgi:hypothetical protein